MPSATIEDYVKAIWRLQQTNAESHRVSNGALAEAVDVTPATVTIMMRTLVDSGLVEHQPRQGVRLTSQGEKLALHVLRRHRLIEQFLVEHLKLDWAEVHHEAEVLEHAVSDTVLERMDKLLGHPRFDPHGAPIPSPQGRLHLRDLAPLDQLSGGDKAIIARVGGQPQVLRFASQHGLTPGENIQILSIDNDAQIIRLQTNSSEECILSLEIAKKIQVEVLS